jgi:hypothetical protein
MSTAKWREAPDARALQPRVATRLHALSVRAARALPRGYPRQTGLPGHRGRYPARIVERNGSEHRRSVKSFSVALTTVS